MATVIPFPVRSPSPERLAVIRAMSDVLDALRRLPPDSAAEVLELAGRCLACPHLEPVP